MGVCMKIPKSHGAERYKRAPFGLQEFFLAENIKKTKRGTDSFVKFLTTAKNTPTKIGIRMTMLRNRTFGGIISAFRLSCSIIEAYLNHLYSAQLITLPVYMAFNSSQTKVNITTKRRRSFAFAFECR